MFETENDASRPNTFPRRRRMYALSALRAARLNHGLRLEDVAREAGLTLNRGGQIERDPSIARDNEIAAMLAAIKALSQNRT